MKLRDERGLSTALEAAIILPGIMMFIGLIVFGARLAMTSQAVEAAANQAARAGSIARSEAVAASQMESALDRALAEHNVHCSSKRTTYDLSQLRHPIGVPGSVTVTVSCTVRMSDLLLPGVPGSYKITATGSSPVDAYRGR